MPFGLKIRSYFWAESLGKVMKFAVHGLCLEVLTSFFLNSDLKKIYVLIRSLLVSICSWWQLEVDMLQSKKDALLNWIAK